MPVIPHAHWLFDSVGLLLRADAASFEETPAQWEMSSPEASRHIAAIGSFYRDDTSSGGDLLPHPLVCALMGAEALAEPEAVLALLDELVSYGMVGELTTTASWVVDRAGTDSVLGALTGRVHALRLQTSRSLLTAPALRQVETLLQSCREHGITVDVHAGVRPGRTLPRELLALEIINQAASFVHVDPDYAGAVTGADDEPGTWLTGPTRMRCAEKFGFYVAPGGAVYPCLAGVGLPDLQIGNLIEQTVGEIVGSASVDAELARLRWDGPAHLDTDDRPGRYLDNCDFHRQLLMSTQRTG